MKSQQLAYKKNTVLYGTADFFGTKKKNKTIL